MAHFGAFSVGKGQNSLERVSGPANRAVSVSIKSRHGGAIFGAYGLDLMTKSAMRFLFLGILVTGIILSSWGAAPYLPRLLLERYPAADWPAHGAFASLGRPATGQTEPQEIHAPNDRLLELFQTKRGKALLVFHDGKLKLEHYRPGVTREHLFNSYSTIKSLVGLLTLRAVADGKIAALDEPLGTFVPAIQDEALRALPLRKLLDMQSGVLFEASPMKSMGGSNEKDLRETIGNPFGPMAQLHFKGIESLLPHLKSNRAEQTVFNYQNVNTSLLGLVLERAYQKPLHRLVDDLIWTPSGAGPAHWRLYHEGKPATAYCCLYARAMDWIYVARFIAANGSPENPLLPDALWRAFVGDDLTDSALRNGVYRNQTRYNILDREGQDLQGPFSYFAGRGGQTIYLMPQHNLIVVRFGDAQQLLHSTLYEAWNSITPQP